MHDGMKREAQLFKASSFSFQPEKYNVHSESFVMEAMCTLYNIVYRGSFSVLHFHLHLSCSLADCWGTTADFKTSFLHSSQFSAFCSMMFHLRPVHSLMWSKSCIVTIFSLVLTRPRRRRNLVPTVIYKNVFNIPTNSCLNRALLKTVHIQTDTVRYIWSPFHCYSLP